MALPPNINDREMQKFEDCDGNIAVRTTVCGPVTATGTFTPTGLFVAGKHSFVTTTFGIWTPLPLVPLAGRNAISIQNESGIVVRIRFVEGIGDLTWKGSRIPGNFGDRFYNVRDSIVIYAMPESGTAELIIEEVS